MMIQIAIVLTLGVVFWVCVSAIRKGSPDSLGLLAWVCAATSGAIFSDICR
jgi:hypothetical protein